MNNSSDYKDVIDLAQIRREQCGNERQQRVSLQGPAVLRRVPAAEPMVVDEPEDPQGMSTEPQSLNDTENKTKALTTALEKIAAAKKSLDEAIATLISEDLPSPVQGIQQGVAELETVENNIQQIIMRLMDSGASHVDKRPHETNDEALTADEQMARMLQDQERQQLNQQYHPNLAHPRQRPQPSHSDDHEFAMSLQRDSDESLARQIQEEEARRYRHRSGSNRFHAQQNANVPSHVFPNGDHFPHRGVPPQLIPGISPEMQQLLARHNFPSGQFLDMDDSDEFSEPPFHIGGQPHFPIVRGRGRGHRQFHNFNFMNLHANPLMFQQLGLQGQDMDDIIRGLEMQNRGATTEDIENFSNEEQYRARSKPAAAESKTEEEGAEAPAADQNHDEQCCICMEKFENGDNIRRLPCMHIFHRDEIDQWLMQNRTCPICKTSIEAGGQQG